MFVTHTPREIVSTLPRFRIVAVSMKRLQVAIARIASIAIHMIDLDPVIIVEAQLTVPTAPMLLFEELGQSSTDARVPSSSLTPIHPVAIIRTPGGLDFHMAADGRVRVQRECASFQRWLEAPAFALVYPPVFAHDPVLGLIRMAGHGPTAQLRIERMV